MSEVHRTKTGKPLGPALLDQFAREEEPGYHPHAAQFLRERAGSYQRDAETFSREKPLGGDQDRYWADLYTTVAHELRQAARRAGGQELTVPVTRPSDRPVAGLGPDAQLVLDESLCIVICTPERRITVGDVNRWREGLAQGKIFQTIYTENAENDQQQALTDHARSKSAARRAATENTGTEQDK